MPSATLRSIRRYPVKCMGGEDLTSVAVDARGLAGDRWFAVEDAYGRFASAKDTRRFRRRDGVLAYAARTGAGGEVRVTGPGGTWSAGDPALDDDLGVPVRVAPEAAVPHQDAGAVSLVGTATLDRCAERWGLDADPRRLRVNLVLATDEPFVEETWVGRTLRCGAVTLAVAGRIERCRTIDVPQDGASARGRWLTPLGRERDLCLGVYADVVAPGMLRAGDAVTVSPR